MADAFTFTKGCQVMKIPAGAWGSDEPEARWLDTLLFDIQSDPTQQKAISDPKIEKMMIDHLMRLLRQSDAPAEQYERLGLRS